MGGGISATDWAKGILLSILASIIGGISKLAIRKSWLMQASTNSDHTFGSDNNLLHNAALDGIEDENDVSRHSEEQLFHEQQTNSNFVPQCIRYSGMFGMSVLNPICCVLAMNYASPSILAPFSGLTLVWVILFSPLVNNEKPSSRQMLACCLIICGEVVVAIFGDHTNDEDVTVQDVEKSYRNPALVAYFFGLTIYAMLMAYWINFSESFILRRFAWGCTGGAITGTQNFLKDCLTVIKASDPQQGLPLVFYPLFVLAGTTAFVGLLFLTACMKRYDATYSAASFVGSFVVSASIMAAVHYDTFAQLNGLLNYVLYPFGIIVLMIGVYLLVKESSGSSQEVYSIDTERQPDANNDEEVNFNSQDMFQYTEVEDEASEDLIL
mmetsp:Transcript_19180/g.47743  ORF Transcript_19180/g.47743 Transcript_19180/m.47743 type:complete len:382 (-) Transcript_19180:91-1236(-)|eukprot:CAMPEP_0116091986 /NCGR_PEP_ID=MMETSP0327-20121206/7796_1 /TAXON_ID=44447 /ORGANISM="Pseudo-nitzschia delicatissima, Strain B596" /LENGTH=381 /DNA_ID=CAMNT_0003583371 /DNA_START=196 /DNA_END=1341 /DNA_ORIENTATION=+